MEVNLRPDQEVFIQQSVRTGRFATTDEAIQEAVSLLENREHMTSPSQNAQKKSLAQLFAESPFRGLDIDFPRSSDPLRIVEL